MRVDFSKHTTGDVVRAHVCRSCGYEAGVNVFYMDGYSKDSRLCGVCSHFGDGLTMDCLIGDWLILTPVWEEVRKLFTEDSAERYKTPQNVL